MAPPRFGVGFRTRHYDELAATPRAVDWLEVVADNFIDVGGARRAMLARLRADHPLALHGVSLSVAGLEPLSERYLRGLVALASWLEPAWVSDHLCWTSFGGRESHDLLPVAYTAEVLAHVADRVARVQDALRRRLLLENATAYVAFRADEMDEAEFLAALCQRTGCGILLDVNNLYVNGCNLGSDPARYLATLPAGSVGYLHLAGHAVLPDVRIDTHDADVPAPVWALFGAAVRRFPAADVIVERDDDLPPLAHLVGEARAAARHHAAALADVSPADARPAAAPIRGASAGDATPRWRALQAGLFAHLVDKPLGFDHRDARLDELLDDRRPVPAVRGMRVYSDAYTASLRRALATNFPTLAAVIGADDFDRLSAAYLCRHPPRGHDFRSLGAQLATFVRTYPFATDYGVPPAVFAELVALEQAQLEVLDQTDDPATIPAEALAAIEPCAWAGTSFTFSAALRIVPATHDVLPAVEAVARGDHPARPTPASVAYLVHRSEERLRTDRIDPRAATIAAALIASTPFATACAHAAHVHGSDATLVAQEAARLLVTLARRGLVLSIRYPSAA